MPPGPGGLFNLLTRCRNRPYLPSSILSQNSNLFSPRPQRCHGLRFRLTQTLVTAPRAPIEDQSFEEETLPAYAAEQFYPVHIGEKLNSRYHVIGKLGFGANSTVWFCRDIR